MDEVDFDSNLPNHELSDREIFTQIWTAPRRVFRYVTDFKYDKYLYVLLFFAGVSSAIDRASNKGLGDEQSLAIIIALAVIIGGSLGWISFYIAASLLSWSGVWIGGKGKTQDIFRMAAYASIPVISALPIVVLQLIIFGNDVFKSEIYLDEYSTFENILYYLFALIEFTIAIWSICIYLVGLSEIQGYSVGKAMLNLLMAFAVIFLPIMLIVAIATSLTP